MAEDEHVVITCISCPMGCDVDVEVKDGKIVNMDGHQCPAGKEYVKEEYYNPTRVLPTTARVKGGVLPLVPVKTNKPMPKGKLEEAMEVIAQQEVEAPVKLGDVIVENILDTGVDIVATRDLPKKGGTYSA
jgi:CxxC motif-containing protein